VNRRAESPVHAASAEAWARHLERSRPVRPSALRRWLAGGTIPALAERTLRSRRDETVLQAAGKAVRGSELLEASAEVARRLGDAGIAAGDRVLLSLPTSIEFVAAYLGILRAGCSVVLANPALTGPELERTRELARPVGGIVSPAVREVLGGAAAKGSAIALSAEAVLVGLSDGEVPGETVGGPSGEAVFAATSGSTGLPKGVPLTHANVLSSIRAVMAAWRWTPDDVVVHCLPLYHQHGLGSLHALMAGGGRTVIGSRFDPEEVAAVVDSERASVLLGVPAMYQRLVESPPRRERFASLRLVVSGSAPLPPVLFERVEEVTGQVPLERYGTTESGLDVSNLYAGPRRPGSVGYPLPGVEVKVGTVAEQAGAGEDGEVLVRGPQVFSGYVGAGAAGEDALVPGGWFRTGDIGRVDEEDGSLSITGRSKDVIISGGMNVYPREVELVLEQHPRVAALAVAGVASQRWGEAVCAFVVAGPEGPPGRGELEELCRRSLAPYKRPKRFLLVGELPRNHMGKVLRASLARLAATADELG